ncbi:MAG: hypothetical protein ABIH76_04665 [Candidatus Bathyarchaeota archaeon]
MAGKEKKKKESPVVSPKLADFARRLRAYKDKKNKLKEELTNLNKEMDEFNTEFVELMEHGDITKFSVEKAGTCTLVADIFPDVKDEPTFFGWLRDNGFKDLIKETVSFQTLKAFCKEQLENKNTLPKGVTVFPKPVVKIRR